MPPFGYLPLVETVRLYCGWLLAWYAVIYGLGSSQAMHRLPFEIPYVPELFASLLIFRFTLGAFLFLLASSLHRAIGGGVWKGIGLALIGLVAFAALQTGA